MEDDADANGGNGREDDELERINAWKRRGRKRSGLLRLLQEEHDATEEEATLLDSFASLRAKAMSKAEDRDATPAPKKKDHLQEFLTQFSKNAR